VNVRRTLLIAGALLVVLLGLVIAFLRTPPSDDGKDPSSPELSALLEIAAADVTGLGLRWSDAHQGSVGAERKDDEWVLTAPRSGRADTDRIDALLRILERTVRKEVQGSDAEYGLDHPQATLTLKTAAKSATLLFGNTGVNYSAYVKVQGADRVLVVESSALNLLPKSADDLRDRLVARFRPEDVSRVRVTRGTKTMAAERNEDAWRLTEPSPAPANEKRVDAALETLAAIGVSVFLADDVTDLSPFGLDPAPLVIEVELKSGKAVGLRVNDVLTQEGRIVLSVEGRGSVYTASPDFLESVPKSAFDWRDRRLTDIQRTEATRIDVENTTGKYSFTAQRDDVTTTWKMTAPGAAAIDSEHIDALLFGLDSAEVGAILDESGSRAAMFGLAKPRATVRIAVGEEVTTIRFGKRSDGGVAVQSSRSPVIGVLPMDQAEPWLGDVSKP